MYEAMVVDFEPLWEYSHKNYNIELHTIYTQQLVISRSSTSTLLSAHQLLQ